MLHETSRWVFLAIIVAVLTGCDMMFEFAQISETTERDLSHQAEEAAIPQEAAPALADGMPLPVSRDNETQEPLPPQDPPVLPVPASGEVVEVEMDGIVFRLTECYRLPVGIACTGVAWNINREKRVFGVGAQSEIVLSSGDSKDVSDWVYGRTRHANLDVPEARYELKPNEMVEFQAVWRGVSPFAETALRITFEMHRSGLVEFLDVPVTDAEWGTFAGRSYDEALQVVLEYLRKAPLRSLRWRYNQFADYVGFRILDFDEETGRFEGKFLPKKLLPDTKGKKFVGQLLADEAAGNIVLQITTIRESGELLMPTREITNANLLAVGQVTKLEMQLYHSELIGRNVDGVAFVMFLW
ncbi:hypothetical protein Mal4_02060 [Maioricimonas rarisocia]|uniref:Uncharacterized protein n=1 Tax=Maioricimonas rarisocia TaxID=2528026 RepID=A0A517Z0B3_9PLAN|nr:hypothetical protein [Maioricimonas rarisocia]QDU35924.1 hypothetical protein Mal4_02060 [Maioricimonas rarisocia]